MRMMMMMMMVMMIQTTATKLSVAQQILPQMIAMSTLETLGQRLLVQFVVLKLGRKVEKLAMIS